MCSPTQAWRHGIWVQRGVGVGSLEGFDGWLLGQRLQFGGSVRERADECIHGRLVETNVAHRPKADGQMPSVRMPSVRMPWLPSMGSASAKLLSGESSSHSPSTSGQLSTKGPIEMKRRA
eukprot:2153655-Pyramimonas_sp.AAC.1